MKNLLTITLICGLSLVANAEKLSLQDANGSNVVTTVLRNGASLQLDGKSYTLLIENNNTAESIERKLKSMLLPSVSFKNSSLDEVLNFLRDQAELRDLKGLGVNIFVSLENPSEIQPVSLEMKRISMYHTLGYIAELTNTDFWIDEAGVVRIVDHGKAPKKTSSTPPALNQSVKQSVKQSVTRRAAPAPVRPAPAPVRAAPAPVRKSPAPVRAAPAPVRKSPAPVRSAPAPVRKSPAPVRSAPAPVRKSPAPVRSAPAPVRSAPAPAVRPTVTPLNNPLPIESVPVRP